MSKFTLSYSLGDERKPVCRSTDVRDVAEALFLAHALEVNGYRLLGITKEGVHIYNTAELAAATNRLRQQMAVGLTPGQAARSVAAEDGHYEAGKAGESGPDLQESESEP